MVESSESKRSQMNGSPKNFAMAAGISLNLQQEKLKKIINLLPPSSKTGFQSKQSLVYESTSSSAGATSASAFSHFAVPKRSVNAVTQNSFDEDSLQFNHGSLVIPR